jgi:ABC-type sugar transport system ATPase subunit
LEEKKPILSLKDIMKLYPGVVALDKVSIDFYPGEVHPPPPREPADFVLIN